MGVGGVCGHERLSLRRNWSKHAILVKTNTVAAPSIGGGIKSRASDLKSGLARRSVFPVSSVSYLPAATVPACYGRSLSWSCCLVRTLRCGRMSIGIRAIGTRRGWKPVRILSSVDSVHILRRVPLRRILGRGILRWRILRRILRRRVL